MLLEVSDRSHVSSARLSIAALMSRHSSNEFLSGKAALIVTEMASNLLKHAGGGNIFADVYNDGSGEGLTLLSLDKGPGIAELSAALTDGFSTAGTPGNGLGAIRRQSDSFDIYSEPSRGTVIFARLSFDVHELIQGCHGIGAVVTPVPGEVSAGDAWAFASTSRGATVMAFDGTGHGVVAAELAQVAVKVFHDRSEEDCVVIVEAIDYALKGSRGGAVAVARIDKTGTLLRFVGVGNIGALIHSRGGTQRLLSHNGTIGYMAPRIREYHYKIAGPSLTVLHSDGLSERWSLADYANLTERHPAVIAGVLYRDFSRRRDDKVVMVLRAP